MINSLNAAFPVLGRILDETPDALRANQRAFVRAGVLEATPGRGPGSGTPASPDALAQFLIGMLTGASRAENVRLAKAIAKARPAQQDGKCPLTGTRTFKDALAKILSEEALAERVRNLGLLTASGNAFITYDGAPWQQGPDAHRDNPRKSSHFVGTVSKRGLRFEASISGDDLLSLAEILI
jgi:hypothetical protein